MRFPMRNIAPIALAGLLLGAVAACQRSGAQVAGQERKAKVDKVVKSDDEWRAKLTPEQYEITRECGTEPPFTGKYYDHKAKGRYHCVACGAPLFQSEQKYDSGSGWPSFWQPAAGDALTEQTDQSLAMTRTEVRCSRCDAHLGHVFTDGPRPTGLRYCINSAALKFDAAKKTAPDEDEDE